MEDQINTPSSLPQQQVPPAQAPSSEMKKILFGLLSTVVLLILLGGAYVLGTKNTTNTTISQVITPTSAPSPTVEPTTVIINSDQNTSAQSGTSSNSSVRTIAYQKITGLEDFISTTGYSFQIPEGFSSSQTSVEKLNSGNSCIVTFTNNGGGVFSMSIRPYNGGPRRQFLTEESTYTYKYEDVKIQGITSLLQEKGPVGDSGSGSSFVIPVGKIAIVGTIDNRAIDNDQFTSMLSSIKFNSTLDISKCGQ